MVNLYIIFKINGYIENADNFTINAFCQWFTPTEAINELSVFNDSFMWEVKEDNINKILFLN